MSNKFKFKFKKQKVKGPTGTVLVSSDTGYDDCAVCRLLKKCEEEKRDPTEKEINEAMIQSSKEGGVVGFGSPFVNQ